MVFPCWDCKDLDRPFPSRCLRRLSTTKRQNVEFLAIRKATRWGPKKKIAKRQVDANNLINYLNCLNYIGNWRVHGGIWPQYSWSKRPKKTFHRGCFGQLLHTNHHLSRPEVLREDNLALTGAWVGPWLNTGPIRPLSSYFLKHVPSSEKASWNMCPLTKNMELPIASESMHG